MTTIILEKSTGAILAKAEEAPNALVRYEGNLYFDPESVAKETLRISERTYTCPYKGTCHWVDFVEPAGRVVQDVAWIYSEPKPGHERIKGRYGFYGGSQGRTRLETR